MVIVNLYSAGADYGGPKKSKAIFTKGDKSVSMTAMDKGFNALVVNPDGDMVHDQTFDTGSEEGAEAFDTFLNGLNEGETLMLSVYEDGQKLLKESSKQYLIDMGADQINDLAYRGGYVFAGVVG
jgi:hypothetical protein